MAGERDIHQRLNQITLLAMDVDGVLTDGGVYILDDGQEFRRFNIKDGLGLQRVMAIGIQVMWITASDASSSALHRARHLGVQEVYTGVPDKAELLTRVCEARGIPLENVAYIGDDLTDLPVIERVGIGCATADAVDPVKRGATYVTRSRGGHGAVREFCDWLLSAVANRGKELLSEKS